MKSGNLEIPSYTMQYDILLKAITSTIDKTNRDFICGYTDMLPIFIFLLALVENRNTNFLNLDHSGMDIVKEILAGAREWHSTVLHVMVCFWSIYCNF